MRTPIRILLIAMSVLILSGCGGQPETASPQPPGTLAAIEYSRRVDMVRDENYSIRVTPMEIVSVEYFSEEDNGYRSETGIPLEEGQWQQLETAALAVLPGLTEIGPQKDTLWGRLFKKEAPFLRDGTETDVLTLSWETEDGTVSVSYGWGYDDPNMQELISMLRSLQQNNKGE